MGQVRAPLLGASVVGVEARREGGWERGLDRSVAALEGRGDRAREALAVERELPREDVEIVEVLVAAVALAEHDHGMELLGDYGLAIVRDCERADVPEALEDRLDLVVAVAREVEVPRRAVDRSSPEGEQHRPLERELLAMRRVSELIEEPLRRVALEDELRFLPPFSRGVEQATMDRGGQVARRAAGHGASASR